MEHTRTDYTGEGLSEDALAPTPYAQARLWVDEAVARATVAGDVPEPLALSLATVDAEGVPNVRTVLMRFFDERGPGFVSCLTSTKGRELAGNPAAAIALTWPSMFRAIRFRGRTELVERDEVERYFDTRPYGSRISAWTSRQSEPIASRAALEAEYERRLAQFPERGEAGEVPVPDFWGGYRLVPHEVEFWGGRRSRLHDRIVFTRVGEGTLGDAAAWRVHRRQP
ncbi:MAG: pyridoxamine 5'-phosphate oxidase [Tetrasphaera sp.]|nr:pyridoxamine 5'-phosphate oxidase [Tetrasphaera sp.]